MKLWPLTLLIVLGCPFVFASAMMNCPQGQTRQFLPQGGFVCAPLYQAYPQVPADCIVCQQLALQRQRQTQPWPAFEQQLPWNPTYYQTPWWAQQGRYSYPNFNYPGIWQYPGVQGHHYPGQGGVFAAKPNVYVKQTSKKVSTFHMQFDTSKGASFLATTPWLEKEGWSGSVERNEFKVDEVVYDYLFYDARLNHTAMQFGAGWCVDRERVVESMMQELRDLKFSSASLKDFHEHWTQKIPNEPVYCVYPQYNAQLDAALPVKITPEAPFVRIVFVVVPHRSEERRPASAFPELPRHSHVNLRPGRPSEDELHYMEWGVAFLDRSLIK